MSQRVSSTKAEKVLAEVKERFSAHLQGAEAAYGPTLHLRISGPVIVWEEGPEEWTLALPPTKVPGVFIEPVNHVILGLYPA